MPIIIDNHAYKHGLTEAQIIDAYEGGEVYKTIRKRDRGTEPQRYALVGFDRQGRAIEIVCVELQDSVLIFHANYLTKAFFAEMERRKYE